MVDSDDWGRRSVLKSLTGGASLLAVGGAGTSIAETTAENATAAADGNTEGAAPAVEWQRSYEGGETEYTDLVLLDLFQTEDGGYALPGRGRPVTKTGPEREQFALLRTDSQGERQSISFAKFPFENYRDEEVFDTYEGKEIRLELMQDELLQTQDGGYVLLGYMDWAGEKPIGEEVTTEGLPAGAVAKYSLDGGFEWFTVIETGADQPHQSGSPATVIESDIGDGLLVAGSWVDEDDSSYPWLVKFGSDGTIQWERTYEELENVERFRGGSTRDGGGYTLWEPRRESIDIVSVDENGNVEDVTEGKLEFSNDRIIKDVISTSDGGFAFAGEDRKEYDAPPDMWLAKLGENLDEQWSKTYDGPYEGFDRGGVVIQTADGGYALGGRMQAAYTGDSRPAIVKTDAEGNKKWEKLLEIEPFDVRLIQTDDGGYAVLNSVPSQYLHNGRSSTLVKLGPEGDGDGDGDTGDGDGTGEGGTGDGDDGEGGEKAASVAFDDQNTDGTAVVVQQATLPEGGYLAIHDESIAILGHSAYLSAGTHSNVEIILDEPLSSDQTLIAIAYTDDGDQEYEFPDADGHYTADGDPVTDAATITVC